jgi:glycogen operon protein
MLGPFATRICGSADLYAKSGKGPECSINFVTCHDGFTLNDLVSYRFKHNEANGLNNHDGTDANFSSSDAPEGDTTDPQLDRRRRSQIKNFLLSLLVSRGVPMLLGGDERRRGQGGNNNAYCQDNETSWLDWTLGERNQDILRFTRGMIAFRRAHPALSEERFYTDAEILWCGLRGGAPDWRDPKEKQLACVIPDGHDRALCLMFNAGAEGVEFLLPHPPAGTRWHLAADTSREAPGDLPAPGEEPLCEAARAYRLSAQASAILLARAPAADEAPPSAGASG